jgi:predicted XRE-type DNA-binding protein
MNEAEGIPGQVFASVWDALEDSPVEAANMRLRSELIIAIRQAVAEWNVSQSAAARRLEVTQPRLNYLLRGRINNFSLDALTILAAHAGLGVRIHIERAAA